MPSQRVIDASQAVSDGSGNLVLRFQSPPGGLAWSGTVSVPTANLGASFTAYMNSLSGIPLGSWLGRSFLGPLYLSSGEFLVVVGSGLANNTAYTGTFLGVSDEADRLPFVSPEPGTSSLSLDTLVAQIIEAGQFNGGDFFGTFYGDIHGTADDSLKLGGQLPGYYATEADLTTEGNNRVAADNTLSTDITNEGNTRATADNNLATSITNEGNTRATADNNLATSITNEANTRATADTNEANTRSADDFKRLKVVGLAGGLYVPSGTPPVVGTEFLTQMGTDFVTTGGAGEGQITFPVAFPNGVLTVKVWSFDTTTWYGFAAPNGSLGTTLAHSWWQFWNAANALVTGTIIAVQWEAVGW